MYLTYEEFATFGGDTDTLDATTFEQYEFEARSLIDWYTFNRLQNEETYPESVKRCMLKLIQLIQERQRVMLIDAYDDEGNVVAGLMAHQSNDGVSATYNVMTGNKAIQTIEGSITSTIKMDLQGVKNSLGRKVLYRGLYPGE